MTHEDPTGCPGWRTNVRRKVHAEMDGVARELFAKQPAVMRASQSKLRSDSHDRPA